HRQSCLRPLLQATQLRLPVTTAPSARVSAQPKKMKKCRSVHVTGRAATWCFLSVRRTAGAVSALSFAAQRCVACSSAKRVGGNDAAVDFSEQVGGPERGRAARNDVFCPGKQASGSLISLGRFGGRKERGGVQGGAPRFLPRSR